MKTSSMKIITASIGFCILLLALLPACSHPSKVAADSAKEFFLEQQALAEQGNIEAQFYLGGLYYKGDGVSQDYKKAAKWFERAAMQGDADAQFMLGTMYDEGKGISQDYPQNYKKAAKWYELAAKQGHANAQNNLGVMHDKGQGVLQDHKKAAKWYKRAAMQGNARAQLNLGVIYGLGQGVPQNYIQSHMWLNLAAANANEEELAKNSTELREAIAKEMTPEDIAIAQQRAIDMQQQIKAQ